MRQSITDDRYADPIYDDPPPAVVKIRRGCWVYRDYTIHLDPPPIPSREADYCFQHDEYDGPEDDRSGYGPTLDSCIDQIDELYENQTD